MLDNGMDSLQKGFEAFLLFEKETISHPPTSDDYLNLKKAVLSTHHGIEILMKYVLYSKSEFLIISSIDKHYMAAYDEKENQSKQNVFQTSIADKVHTITFDEAVERIKHFAPVKPTTDFVDKLKTLNRVRNALTHAEIEMNDQEIVSIFPSLLNDLDVFFFSCIGYDYKTLSGYGELQKNYDDYMKILVGKEGEVKRKTTTALKSAIEKSGLSIGENDVTYITDKTRAKAFVSELEKAGLQFGTDLYNFWNSGDVNIHIVDNDHFSLQCKDLNSEFIFKFKSLIVAVPEIPNKLSPILIFESDKDETPLLRLPIGARSSFRDHEMVEGCYFTEDDREEFDMRIIAEMQAREEYDEKYTMPKHVNRCYFMIGRIFAALNVQGLFYTHFRTLLKATETMNGHEVAVRLRQQ